MRYGIFEQKSGQQVAELDEEGRLVCPDPLIRAVLERVVGRELLTRESDDPEEFGELVEEGAMCYMGMRSLRPGDPDYLTVLARQLPLLTNYFMKRL